MKYIRTNEGIFEVLDKETDICVLTNKAWKYKKDIISQADTIEGLCDEFVYINKVGKFDKPYVIHFQLLNRKFTEPTIKEKLDYIYKCYKKDLHKIKGAIYTDKGLIYVAKPNNKGGFELI